MKKFCSILLVFMILSLFAGCGAPDKKTDEKKDENSSTETVTETDTTKKADFPAPRAASAIVIDANSGDVLYSLDAEKKLYPANTVNIMTAIVALENASLGDPLIVQGGAVANAKYDHTDLLGLPEDFEPLLGLAVGYPPEPLVEREIDPDRIGTNYIK